MVGEREIAMDEQENKNIAPVKYGVLGLVVGLGVGALAGLALSPKSGKENREIVINQYGKAKDATMSKLKKSNKAEKKAAKKTPAKK